MKHVWTLPHTLLMPAKAGIQRRASKQSAFSFAIQRWVPASAGTNGGEV
jgi:hypothetical protein